MNMGSILLVTGEPRDSDISLLHIPMAIELYLHENSSDVIDDVRVRNYILDAIVSQTHNPQLLS